MIKTFSRLQARIVGKNASGKENVMYVSNQMDDKLDFRIGNSRIFVDTKDFYLSFVKLMENLEQTTGETYIPKHAGGTDDKVDM